MAVPPSITVRMLQAALELASHAADPPPQSLLLHTFFLDARTRKIILATAILSTPVN